MKILAKDIKKGFVKLQVENLDDLWYLSQIIDIDDRVKGVTTRKIKVGDKDERNNKSSKKKVFLEIAVEKVEFHKYSDSLRVLGRITQGPDDISVGTHHSFSVEENTIIAIQKEKFLGFQAEKLNEAAKEKKSKVLICAFDRENAVFALVKNYGYDVLLKLQGDVKKKEDRDISAGGSFYRQIIIQLKEYDNKFGLSKIVLASPAFWKEYLLKELENEKIKEKVLTATCSATDESGINEVIRRPEVKSALSHDRIIMESGFVEELMAEISKNGSYVYGISETEKAAGAGAAKMILVTDSLIRKMREQETYSRLDNIMKTADSMKAKIHVISSEHDSGKKLDGLGGIGAVLRYRLNHAV